MSEFYENEKLDALIKHWELTGEMNVENAQIISNNLEPFMTVELRAIDNLLNKNQPNVAFVKLTRLVSIINSAIAKLPSIISALQTWVNAIKSSVSSIAKSLGAHSFSISVSLTGISISLSFNISYP